MKRSISIFIFGALFALACGASQVALYAPAPSAFPDTEAETNIVFSAGAFNERRFGLDLDLCAASNNCVMVEFGVDGDMDGALDPGESEVAVGWDCGEWVFRDKRGAFMRRVPAEAGERRLSLSMRLGGDAPGERFAQGFVSGPFRGEVPQTAFNAAWNILRVVVRGADASNAHVSVATTRWPLVITIR